MPRTQSSTSTRQATAKRRRPLVDELDRRLLTTLQDGGRTTNAELARRYRVTGPGIQKRLKRLEQDGVIQRYTALVNREAIGLDLLCFVEVMLAHHRAASVRQFPQRVEALPEVLECYYLTGEVDYLLKVVVANHDHLERLLFDKLMKMAGVDRVRTSIVLKEVKATTSLPLTLPE